MIRSTLVVIALGIAPACGLFAPKPDMTPTLYDASDACAVACDNLASSAVDCPEARGVIGGDSCRTICLRTSELRPLPLGCWSRATDAASARACGSLRCVK